MHGCFTLQHDPHWLYVNGRLGQTTTGTILVNRAGTNFHWPSIRWQEGDSHVQLKLYGSTAPGMAAKHRMQHYL